MLLPACGGGPDFTAVLSTVELRVHDTTCGSADVTWIVWTVSWEDRNREVVSLPWSRTRDYHVADIELVAVRECSDDGTVSVEIYVDGVLRRSRSAQGANAVASTEFFVD
jgi:hypothetical protein